MATSRIATTSKPGRLGVKGRWLLSSLILCTQLACARPDLSPPDLSKHGLAPKVELSAVPFFAQTERDDCGPAALAMMLGSTGLDTNPAELAPKIYTPGREGTLQADIVQAIRREGRLGIEVKTFQNLLKELDAGHPVLVLQNLGVKAWPIWHYAVAMGYDLESRTLFLHSGKQEKFPLSFSTFLHTWDDQAYWGLTVTDAGQLPASASPATILEAASGLEQVSKRDEAARAYGALLQRWPDNLPALMGWGNARYASGDYRAASQAFRHAVALHPQETGAWNNLAYSLLQQDRLEEALNAAEEAVNLGGPHQAEAKATLQEIKAKLG